MRRLQESLIRKDLEKKIVFLVGPRQVGKTWLAQRIGESFERSVYLNYDRLEDRRIIEKEAWLDSTELLILDELHKMPAWKNHLKGIYDTRKKSMRILVTGSARLDAFRQVGDALSGRFFLHRLLPFSLSELEGTELAGQLDRLMARGGFPEPLLAEDPVDVDRWRMLYVDGLVRSEVLDFDRIHDLGAMQTVLQLLQRSVGSTVSYASIARDVAISPNTVKKYIQILEALFIVFRVLPHSRNVARSLLKEPKIYFYDIGMVKKEGGARFENLMALSLLKHVRGRTDAQGQRVELRYLRTKQKKEVDFCLVNENEPELMLEAKLSESQIDSSLIYFHERLGIPAIQVVKNLKRERQEGNIQVLKAERYLRGL
ncbi:MAG: ATP-binding protein [Deltaproteobacteria bacterium]|nr:ATP-binding protein [Deltaproteobacteria bacterium]